MLWSLRACAGDTHAAVLLVTLVLGWNRLMRKGCATNVLIMTLISNGNRAKLGIRRQNRSIKRSRRLPSDLCVRVFDDP